MLKQENLHNKARRDPEPEPESENESIAVLDTEPETDTQRFDRLNPDYKSIPPMDLPSCPRCKKRVYKDKAATHPSDLKWFGCDCETPEP